MPRASVKKTVSARKAALVFGTFCAVVILGVSAYVSVSKAPRSELRTQFITFGGKRFQVAVADTNKARAKGLGDYESLANDEGMLFVFERPGKHCFWMKDVEFPIGIFWLDEERRVVKSIDSLSPDTYPELFCPEEPVNYVLEIAGGQAQNLQKPLKLEL
ncbi:MAG: DUF192 domain-containing protein [Candidatus Saccharibacteria bacterium]|nr:DUF192 domain-containing protein [Candidatus Saccharibacteria bacterium]